VTPGATAIVADDLGNPFEAARDEAARGIACVELSDHDPPLPHAAAGAPQELVLLGQRQVVQDVDQQQRVHFAFAQLEQIERLELPVSGGCALGDGHFARVRVEAKELATAAELP